MKNSRFWYGLLLIFALSFFVWYVRGGFNPPLSCKYENSDKVLICIDVSENQLLKTPAHLTGEARGYWFFEGSFPVSLLDESDNLLARSIAVADMDWMTEEMVSFTIDFKFEKPLGKIGTLVLYRDNPSGLPQNDDSLEIPVKLY
ncbi:MAG: Gmad2 immunoglobulin-like domain-containing protein [Patescibacteria group bacterium]|nr:Gmad2 immunoglobulin-like domain-containing protein [Patescibacteria group bacterium]